MSIGKRWMKFLLAIATAFCLVNVCQAFAADVSKSQIPYKREAISSEPGLPRLAIGFIVCAVALAGSVYFVRHRLGLARSGVAQPKQLRVLESQRLGPRSMLHVIEFSGSRYLIVQSEQGTNCSVVATVPSATASGQT